MSTKSQTPNIREVPMTKYRRRNGTSIIATGGANHGRRTQETAQIRTEKVNGPRLPASARVSWWGGLFFWAMWSRGIKDRKDGKGAQFKRAGCWPGSLRNAYLRLFTPGCGGAQIPL